MEHKHEYAPRRKGAKVEFCACGKWQHAPGGAAIIGIDKEDAAALARVVWIVTAREACADRLAQIYGADVARVERLARAGDDLSGRVSAALTARLDAEAQEDTGELDAAVRVGQALAVVDVIAGALAAIHAEEGTADEDAPGACVHGLTDDCAQCGATESARRGYR